MGFSPGQNRPAKLSFTTATAPANDLDAHRLEVARTHGIGAELHVLAFRRRVALHLHAPPLARETQRQDLGQRHGLHTGQRAGPPLQLGVERLTAGGVVALDAQLEPEQGEALGAEAGIEAAGVPEAGDEEPGGGEHDERHGHLPDDQRIPQPEPTTAGGGRDVCPERGRGIEPGRTQGWNERGEHHRRDRDRQREEEDATVERELERDGHRQGRPEGAHRVRGP
jgi:hypothetical protein